MKKIAFGIGCFLLLVMSSLQAKGRKPTIHSYVPFCVFNIISNYHNKPNKPNKPKLDDINALKKGIRNTYSTYSAGRVYEIRRGKRGIRYCQSKKETKETKESCESWRDWALIVSGLSKAQCSEIQKQVRLDDKKSIIDPISKYVSSVDSYQVYKYKSNIPFDLTLQDYPYLCITTAHLKSSAIAKRAKNTTLPNAKQSEVRFHINFIIDPDNLKSYKPNCDSVYKVLKFKPQPSSSKDTKDTKDTEDFIARAINIDDKKPKIKQWINDYWKKLDDNTHVHTS